MRDVFFSSSFERPLPYSIEDEQAVLGSMLSCLNDVIDDALLMLSFDGCFYDPRHSLIFNAIVELFKSGLTTVDLVLVCNELEKRDELENVGGRVYVTELLYNAVSTALFVPHAKTVVAHAQRRELIRVAADAIDKAFDTTEDAETLLDETQAALFDASQYAQRPSLAPIGANVSNAIEVLDELVAGNMDVLGVSTGYVSLDNVLRFRDGEMIVVAARPSYGKTALMLNIAENLAIMRDEPIAVGVVSIEMGADQLTLRAVCSMAQISITDIAQGAVSPARWDDVLQAGKRLQAAPIVIDDTPKPTVLKVRSVARRMVREHGIRVLFVDYLQLLKPDDVGSTRESEVAAISGGLKAIARELHLPVVVLAQLNRQAEDKEGPRVSHLRESGAIEQDADIVVLIGGERGNAKELNREIIVAKNRNGPTGNKPMVFKPQITQYVEPTGRCIDPSDPAYYEQEEQF